jgi:hypothetical protein
VRVVARVPRLALLPPNFLERYATVSIHMGTAMTQILMPSQLFSATSLTIHRNIPPITRSLHAIKLRPTLRNIRFDRTCLSSGDENRAARMMEAGEKRGRGRLRRNMKIGFGCGPAHSDGNSAPAWSASRQTELCHACLFQSGCNHCQLAGHLSRCCRSLCDRMTSAARIWAEARRAPDRQVPRPYRGDRRPLPT